MAEGPLAGVTVVVTRAEGQASTLVDLFESKGATVVAVPLVDIVDLDCAAAVVRATASLTRDDWVAVSSANSARALARAVPVLAAKVAAVGPATAAQLPHVDLVPERNSAAGLLAVFPTGHGRVVVLQAEGGAPTLVEGLRARGWSVERIDTHVSRPRLPSAAQQLALLRADAVAFTSGSQAKAWAEVLGTASPPVVVAIGAQTAEDAHAAGLVVSAVADEQSLAGVVRAVEAAFAR